MAISSFTDDVNIISALGDNPNTDDSLSAAQLKAKFDFAANLIKTYINNTMVGAINGNSTGVANNATAIAGLGTSKADAATTLAGYGITDAMTAAAITAALALKQDLIHVTDTAPTSSSPDGIYLVYEE